MALAAAAHFADSATTDRLADELHFLALRDELSLEALVDALLDAPLEHGRSSRRHWLVLHAHTIEELFHMRLDAADLGKVGDGELCHHRPCRPYDRLHRTSTLRIQREPREEVLERLCVVPRQAEAGPVEHTAQAEAVALLESGVSCVATRRRLLALPEL